MKKRVMSMVLVCALLLSFWIASPASKAAATAASDEYTTLTADTEITLNGETLVVDLAGYNLTVKGTGKVCGFDSANDTFDHLKCGVLTAETGVTCESVYIAPNGNRYVALTEGSYTTFHRLDMQIKTVTLRMSNAGLYYKAFYQCDRQVEEQVTSYGVVVSLQDVPGADFKSVSTDAYTVCTEKFVSGAIATSGSVVDIMKPELTASENKKRSRMPLYANAYIDLGDGPIVADTANVGQKAGARASLAQVLAALDANYANYGTIVQKQLDDFNNTWKGTGVNLNLTNIGKKVNVDWEKFNADLQFDAGTTNAYCPVCEKKVTWTPMTSTTEPTTAADGGHYYLPDDLVFDNDNERAFMYAPSYGGQEACFHLNGHNVTSLNWRTFHSGSGQLNIMGNGEVAGYNKKSIHGAAIHSTNKSATSKFVLYGGTFKKTPGTPYNGAVIYISDGGGNLEVYESVQILADANGKPGIYVAKNNYRECNISLRGCYIGGTIGFDEGAAHKTNIELIDTTVRGNITLRAEQNMTLSGKVSLTRLTVQEDARVSLKSLDPDAYIKVRATGEFTTTNSGIEKYLDCFVSYESKDTVLVKNNALYCGRDYTADLAFEEGTTNAFCPACGASKTWTEIVAGDAAITLTDGGHYYLAEDQIYTGGGTAFLSFTNKADICVHLNGHNLTSNTRALYTGTGTANIMGTGVVTGTPYSSTTYGAALHHNSKAGVINLYSGTYRQTEAVGNGYTLNMHGAGGTLNIYEDAVVESNVNGNAIRVGNASSANIAVNVIGSTVDGKVYMVGAKTPETYTTSLTIDGGKINGTVNIDGTNNFTVAHDAQIELLDLEDTTKVTMDRLISGADITVKNPGEFANENEKAADYAKYFKAAWINDKILSQGNVLRYKINYTADLLLDAENEALCPACQQIVKWTAFTDDTQDHTFTDGGHFYLTNDLLYAGEENFLNTGTPGTVTCLHLNGNNITATNSYPLFISSGSLNVMGDGTVMGKNPSATRPTALFSNNKNGTNYANLYSGTYTKYDSSTSAPIITIGSNGGNITIHEDAVIDAPSTGMAINTGNATGSNSILNIKGAAIEGDITIPGAAGEEFTSTVIAVNTTVTGDVNVNGAADVTFSGKTKIGKLIPKAGQLVGFENLLDGSSVKVSADGVFSNYMAKADEWLQYFSTSDSGDWLIVRDKTFYQGAKTSLPSAEQTDIEALLAAYGDRVVRYGECHNHSSSGPVGGADGYKSIEEWREGMAKLNMDFATIVDHRQSSHMYVEDWNNDQVTFLGGTESGSNISDLPDGRNNIHMNLIFSDPAQLESLITSGHPLFTNVAQATDGWSGLTFKANSSISQQEIRDLVVLVQELGGFFAHVHPKWAGYVDSDNPLDYYYGEYTGIEVMCSSAGNYDSRHKYNVDAYNLWVDLLELDKKVYATYGNDDHNNPTTYALSAYYTATTEGSEYMQHMRAGDFTPGWVGVRMKIGDTLMGGTTNFEGQRLVISAGEMFADKYNASHKYTIQLYDDGGLLFESELNPSEMNYYAMDADPEAKFYRVLIWDTTIGAHVAVGNPIWNG